MHDPAPIDNVRVSRTLDAAEAMPQTRQGIKAGYVDKRPLGPTAFRPTIDLTATDTC